MEYKGLSRVKFYCKIKLRFARFTSSSRYFFKFLIETPCRGVTAYRSSYEWQSLKLSRVLSLSTNLSVYPLSGQ